MQNNQPASPSGKGKNIAVIAGILILAAALMAIARLNADRPIDLSTLAPSASPSPAATETPAGKPAPTDAQGAGDVEAFVLISVAGRPHSIEPLNEDRDVEIAQENGAVNVVHITHNGFHMKSSTCDNQLCVDEGEVTVDNYSRRILGPYVLCLPNQVELQLVVPSATTPPDMPDI
ncbi:MAG: NusG domain II-containing protein [Clostridia bacterium]|nr:NusG domain II-containing protein [Clostridia bacterium]